MRTFRTILLACVATVFLSPANNGKVNAQEFSTGMDIYSSYIWRGAKFGSGPAFQPYVEYSAGGFALGAWGSVNSSANESLEMDLYIGYDFDFGLSLAVTDYYFGGDWTDAASTHYIEPMASFAIGDLSLTGAYMLLPEVEDDSETEADESADFGEEGDVYLEAAYSFGMVDLALGAGNGQYVSPDDDFMICNITIGTSKEITITESFALPVSGAVTLNPSTGGFFITAGVSF